MSAPSVDVTDWPGMLRESGGEELLPLTDRVVAIRALRRAMLLDTGLVEPGFLAAVVVLAARRALNAGAQPATVAVITRVTPAELAGWFLT